MKLNKLLIVLILIGILTCGLTVVFAEYGQLDNGREFVIPEGYSIFSNRDGLVGLISDDEKEIITIHTNGSTAEKVKEAEINNGYQFHSETTKNISDIEVLELYTTKEGFYYHTYFFKVNDNNFIVSSMSPYSQWNIDDDSNPANVIISSLSNSFNNSNESKKSVKTKKHGIDISKPKTQEEWHEILCEDE